ncbi:uncharacterized protein LOC144438550 [Glandiceps talaboti]
MADDTKDFFAQYRKTDFSLSNGLKECFEHFDVDGDGLLDASEFSQLCKSLFIGNHGGYRLSEEQVKELIQLLDDDNDGKINLAEFNMCWKYWFRQVLSPVSALLVIDIQNDFIDGSLALKNCPAGQDGGEVIPLINKLIEEIDFDVIAYTRDWHPANHISFFENLKLRELAPSSPIKAEDAKMLDTVHFAGDPVIEQTLWPTHCVPDTWGAEFHKDLKVVDNAIDILKGTNPDIDSYSAFWDNMKLSQTTLAKELQQRKVTDVYMCGLAYDFCLGSSSVDAAQHGFRTVVIEDTVRGVDVNGIGKMRKRMKDAGCVFVNSKDVPDMVNCKDRRPDLGYQAAVNVAVAKKIQQNGLPVAT